MFFAIIVNTLVVMVTVLLHYDALYWLSNFLPKLRIKYRFRIVLGVFGALTAHAMEVWLFGIIYYFIHHSPHLGILEGSFDGSLLDCVYFSFTTYTTLGFGDIHPHGEIRYLVGIESLTGLVLITWSASFLYLEMDKYWKNNQ